MAPSAHRSLAGQQLIGRVLADRYRIEAVIGTGASGRVYAAHDTRLDRPVAVKILHAALAEDAGFQRRFRAEAQFAASLHHPNIVTVHDWGQERISDEEQLSFMVLELLEGGSLRSMLDAGTRLSPAQAARIGAEVAAALDYAHRRGIVHRDVKPANLLFDEHGVVRIADFGLARALAEASWTEPSGAVFGTARYASPEQWLGVQLDARSDLYSLALVIVESVTGDIPFSADTTIGLLSARTQRPIVAPDELGPLGAVVERAGRVDPAERYPDAGVMRSALLDAAEALPVPGPLRLAGMIEGGADPHPTRAVPPPGPTRPPKTAPARRAVNTGAGTASDDDIEVIEADPVVLFDQDLDDDAERAAGAATARVRRPRRLVPLAVALAVVLGVAGVAAVIAQLVGGLGGGSSVAVPGLVGRPIAQAKALAEDAGLTVSTRSAASATSDPAGIVIDQTPAAGAFAAGDAKVVLVVSSGPAKVTMPDVVGKTLNRARQELAARGLSARVERSFDEQAERGRVLAQATAPGTKVAGDSEVALTVSDGPEPREVPSFAGKTWNEAKAALEGLGLVAGYNEDFSDSVPLGYVIATTPAAGEQAERGARVTVLVSKGPALVTVPNVIGRSLDAATVALERVGLVVDTVKGYRPGRTVRSQSLAAGSQARRGSTIDLSF